MPSDVCQDLIYLIVNLHIRRDPTMFMNISM